MDKKEIRKKALGRRDCLTPAQIEDGSREIFERLRGIPVYRDAEKILVYASMRSEVCTDEIILDALGCGKEVFCPRVTDRSAGKMEFVRINYLEDLTEGFYGIREPEITDVSEIYEVKSGGRTLVIMPGVAFDRERNRIGYNGGFYDRYLAENAELLTLAIAFECQVFDELLPAEEHDIRPGLLVTEKEIYGQKKERDN